MWRVIARRAASIWRAVTRSGSSAFRPNSPKFSAKPPLATPWMRPLKALRNLVFFGCIMVVDLQRLLTAASRPRARDRARAARGADGASPEWSASASALVLRHRIVLEDLALEDPDLDAARAVGGVRGGDAVVDVGAQRVQRHAALAIPFEARDFGAAEAAGAVDADALGAEAHRRLHRALHRAAEGDAALELLGDRIGDQRRVDLGLAHFDDVDRDFRLRSAWRPACAACRCRRPSCR